MNAKISFEDLVLFIREEIGEFKMAINESSLIEDDLGVTGLDAVQLIKNYAARFDIDILEFNYRKYFYSEPSIFFWTKRTKAPLTVGDLYKGIIVKKLDDSIIE